MPHTLPLAHPAIHCKPGGRLFSRLLRLFLGIATISSVVPAFVKPGDVLFSDNGIHFCAAVGARLTRGKERVFAHNDMVELESLLRAQEASDEKLPPAKRPRRFILVEGLYANSGDLAPLPELIRLRDAYGCYLIVDETYSFGSLGKTGRGISEHFGMQPSCIDILVGSLEHSLGSVGGFCAGSSMIVRETPTNWPQSCVLYRHTLHHTTPHHTTPHHTTPHHSTPQQHPSTITHEPHRPPHPAGLPPAPLWLWLLLLGFAPCVCDLRCTRSVACAQ